MESEAERRDARMPDDAGRAQVALHRRRQGRQRLVGDDANRGGLGRRHERRDLVFEPRPLAARAVEREADERRHREHHVGDGTGLRVRPRRRDDHRRDDQPKRGRRPPPPWTHHHAHGRRHEGQGGGEPQQSTPWRNRHRELGQGGESEGLQESEEVDGAVDQQGPGEHEAHDRPRCTNCSSRARAAARSGWQPRPPVWDRGHASRGESRTAVVSN
jgi:hypothetical protein